MVPLPSPSLSFLPPSLPHFHSVGHSHGTGEAAGHGGVPEGVSLAMEKEGGPDGGDAMACLLGSAAAPRR